MILSLNDVRRRLRNYDFRNGNRNFAVHPQAWEKFWAYQLICGYRYTAFLLTALAQQCLKKGKLENQFNHHHAQ